MVGKLIINRNKEHTKLEVLEPCEHFICGLKIKGWICLVIDKGTKCFLEEDELRDQYKEYQGNVK